jgi:hypothetical protein
MSIFIPTRYFEDRPDPSSVIDGTVLRAAAGATAILTVKVAMLWTALQAI